MSKKILINATEEEESRVAVLADNVLQEFYIERASMNSFLGNIYMGKIINVEPSIGAAFVDIGITRNGFIHVSDVNPALLTSTESQGSEKAGSGKDKKTKSTVRNKDLKIKDLLNKDQEIIVQVSKDGIGEKGPTLTSFISVPGRFLVFMPGVSKKGVSRKIKDDAERERLKELVSGLNPPQDTGVIVRTAGANQTKRELQKDNRYLTNVWNVICERSRSQNGPALLYKENDLIIRVLRDIFSSEVSEVLIDSEEVFKRAVDFMKIILPRHTDKVKFYRGRRPLFDRFKLEKELESMLEPRIPLKSGGSLVIEQTEALVSIDVNSGKFKGGELEETAFAINIEASKEIARQLRLRDLGGLIVIDYIDMLLPEHRSAVEKEFREALKGDRARLKMAKISGFGVIEMTRQRVRPSLKSFMHEKCSFCHGTGYVASVETTCLNIIRKIRLWAIQKGPAQVTVRVNDRMAEYLLNSKRRFLLELEEKTGKSISITGDAVFALGDINLENRADRAKGQGVLF